MLGNSEFTQLAIDGYLLFTGTNFNALEWSHSRVYNPSLLVDVTGSGTLVCGVTNTLWEGEASVWASTILLAQACLSEARYVHRTVRVIQGKYRPLRSS